ncbi:MAG: arginine deiminase family protein, partial [Saprospiraceae bacterium]
MKPDLALNVNSEISPLLKVIVHSPDEGILRVSPKKSEELLFDDIVYLPAMQAEHKIFTDVLRALIGKEHVYETQKLLQEALGNNVQSKEHLIRTLLEYEELPPSFGSALAQKDHADLAEILITGYDPADERVLFDPIPNFLFTRDIAVAINDHILITKAAKQARTRENFLTRFIMYQHPLFADISTHGRLIDMNLLEQFPPSKKGEPVSMEGGDVMILNQDYIIIGISERTNLHAFHSLKSYLFKNNIISNVVLFNIPSERSFMHIDTIITQIDVHQFVAYKPIVKEGSGSFVEVHRSSGEIQKYATMKKFLRKEISNEIEFTWVGNGVTPTQEREQWTDGCNLLAVRPGVAIIYDRNPVTSEVLKEKGYNILTAHQIGLLSDLELKDLNKTIIAIPSGELARARGG